MPRLIIAMLSLCLLVGPAYAGYPEGITAYQAGRYDVALKEFRPLSERGNADAEFMLGVMYFYGRGVRQDNALAAVWFYKAASKGNSNGQLAFGSLYIRGTGVRRDLVQAYKWLSLAAESGVPGLQQQAMILRDDAAQLMTRAEVERAQRLVADFQPVEAGLVSAD